jgi:hypothetical protein
MEMKMSTSKAPRKIVYRDSSSGQFVTERYADRHPKTTERQHVVDPSKR